MKDWGYWSETRFGCIPSRPFLEELGCGSMRCIARRSREGSPELAGRAEKCRSRLSLRARRILARDGA